MPKYLDKEFNNHSHSRKVLNKAREYRQAQIYRMYMVERRKEIDISKALGCAQSTVSSEVNAIRERSKAELRQFLSEHLPLAFSISLNGVDAIIALIWEWLSNGSLNLRISDKVNLLSLLVHCYDTRLEMSGNGDLISEGLRQMELVKRQLLQLHPEQAELIESRLASYQTGGVVTKDGELKQEQVLREQQQQQERQQSEQIHGSINSIKEEEFKPVLASRDANTGEEEKEKKGLDDENSRKETSSAAGLFDNNNFSESTHLEQQNDERLSLADNPSSSSSNFEYEGNGNGNANVSNPKPKRPTRNKVF
jgi:hypothetical protein